MDKAAGPRPSPVTGDLIIFDGECVLCSHFFQFMLRHDKGQRFSFATAQSELGQRLYRERGLPMDDFETNLVFVEGRCYQRLNAFAAAMRALPGLWWILGLCRFLPGFVKDPLYHLIARNRYRLFGRMETCMVPGPDIRARFLDWEPVLRHYPDE
ncbi:DCC1-like thiol-disulfide oxidoreductase family protein [Pseudophaeobacter sp.]|uniref:thiol-disulfide oxidoreductase DCC family protein n=1 Tax=Pseudophaeobacter sp. TaxID=1971739 RepID=UPI0032994E14